MSSLDYAMYGTIEIPTKHVKRVRAAFKAFLDTNSIDDDIGAITFERAERGKTRVSMNVNCSLSEYGDDALNRLENELEGLTNTPGFLTLRCSDVCGQESDYRVILVGDSSIASAMFAVDRMSEVKSIDETMRKRLVAALSGRAVIVTSEDDPAEALKMLQASGLEIGHCVRAFGASTEEEIAASEFAKRNYETDDVEFDDLPVISPAKEGCWVSSWHWISYSECRPAKPPKRNRK